MRIISLILLLLFGSCHQKSVNDYDSLNEAEKEELSNWFDTISEERFLQPSAIHRVYKDSALILQPNNVDIRQRLSYSYKKVGEHMKAMEVLNKAVEIDISNGKSNALEYRAWTLLYYYRDYEGAVRDVDLIEKITNNFYNSCWGEPCGLIKGQALYKLGNYKEAIERFKMVTAEEEALGFDGNFLVSFYTGRCYAGLGEYNKAIGHFEASLGSVKKFPEAYFQLGLVYEKLDDQKMAIENFNLAKKYIKYSMNEPYIERFDEVFEYMIDRKLAKSSDNN
ncbi:tetratricopeptide repeat protein [Marivirga harenae]|uniref:tetratricopeptide repeat protein n=1 Tax=Marivirga harenae TaxID=2010992 RepID=UPI0026E014FC|nr:tetratricopeptide repeat protein [Marivirga harenae]WKV12258.1 tetratricopeptide repeat protein [Marivirga harenae]